MTDKQYKFILSLVDQYGYKDSPLKDKFLEKILNKADGSIEFASYLIDRLMNWNKQRKFFKKRKPDTTAAPTVQDFSQFVFCSASYAIRQSYVLEPLNENDQYKNDEAQHSFLLERLEDIGREIINADEDVTYRKMLQDQFQDFERFYFAKLVYNGYLEDAEPRFYQSNMSLHGKPHLVFEDRNQQRFAVVEKVSFSRNLPDELWPSQLAQALSYLYFFEELKVDEVAVIVWNFKPEGKYRYTREYRIHWLSKSTEFSTWVHTTCQRFLQMRRTGEISFAQSAVNPQKCFKCACRSICNHKSGLITGLKFPYETPEYSKKYPLYYTIAEELELIHQESQEFLEEMNEIEAEIRKLNQSYRQDDNDKD